MVFDNSKIRRVALGWEPRISLEQGAAELIEWFDADPERRRVDPATDALHDIATTFMRAPIESLNSLV